MDNQLLHRTVEELHALRPLLPTYIHLLISAVFPIYTASHAALVRPSSAAPPAPVPAPPTSSQDPSDSDSDSDSDANADSRPQPAETVTLTPSDALLFPVLAGCTLAGLYVLLRWLPDPAVLNYWLGPYFAGVGGWMGVGFVADGLAVARSWVWPDQYSSRGRVWRVVPGERRFVVEDGDGGGGGGGDGKDEVTTTTTTTNPSPLPGRLLSTLLPSRLTAPAWRLREFLYTRLRLTFKTTLVGSSLSHPLKLDFSTLDVLAACTAVPLVYTHTFVAKPWWLTNMLGFAFCHGSLQLTTLGTAATGTLLLAALFVYDVYFVFFTPVMVTVATGLDVPIKLLFPRPATGCGVRPDAADVEALRAYRQCLARNRATAMLGLGDIVVPGLMLAFALRFDLYLHYLRQKTVASSAISDEKAPTRKSIFLPVTGNWGEYFWTAPGQRSPALRAKTFPKRYFTAGVAGYVIGMVVTVVVMQVSKHAQPALLYLVPGVLGALWGTAAWRGEVAEFWRYSEVDDNKEGEGGKGAAVVKKKEGEEEDEKNQGKNKGKENGQQQQQQQRDNGGARAHRKNRQLINLSLEVIGRRSWRRSRRRPSDSDNGGADKDKRVDPIETDTGAVADDKSHGEVATTTT